jgi:predicted glycosyltransferase
MRVWIDAANSPHPLLFAPVSERLEAGGHEVCATARDHAQTAALARRTWPDVTLIGAESPGGRAAKAVTLLRRIRALRGWARREQPDVALSHNSYAQIVAARSLGIATVTAMDFEHQPANHLAFRLADTVLLPDCFPTDAARRQGAPGRKVVRYPGLKESLYLGASEVDESILETLGAKRPARGLIAVARTPPSRALYHRRENQLFIDCLRAISQRDDTVCIVLARHPEQREAIASAALERCIIPAEAIDTSSLLYAADLFLGAGGTMTREAALIGIPTFSVFAGEAPAVDDFLVERGLMRRLTDPAPLLTAAPRASDPRSPAELRAEAEVLLEIFVDAVEAGPRARG